MSGSARTAEVTVTVRIKITDTATEGEMLDAVLAAIKVAKVELWSPDGSFEILNDRASVVTVHTGGHLS